MNSHSITSVPLLTIPLIRMKLFINLSLGILLSANMFGQENSIKLPAQLLSGPLVGHTTSSMANIWVETNKTAEVKVHYWVESGTHPIFKDVAQGRTSEEAPHVGIVKL